MILLIKGHFLHHSRYEIVQAHFWQASLHLISQVRALISPVIYPPALGTISSCHLQVRLLADTRQTDLGVEWIPLVLIVHLLVVLCKHVEVLGVVGHFENARKAAVGDEVVEIVVHELRGRLLVTAANTL